MTPAAGTDSARVAQLEAEVVEARENFDAQRTKSPGARPTSSTQLRKLQEALGYAEARLKRARGSH